MLCCFQFSSTLLFMYSSTSTVKNGKSVNSFSLDCANYDHQCYDYVHYVYGASRTGLEMYLQGNDIVRYYVNKVQQCKQS